MSLVLSVENLSKSYRLGTLGSRALRDDLSRWWARFRGRPDPLSRVGDDARARPHGEPFFALQDVSFDVVRGEVLGIIGPNGAGKSTLLKILSQVTAPTTGRIRIRGRIASLLEVGTGFHPELTGRENVFLNGAILGMRKREIANRYDEIVAFSGVERFIDTPVKRYSSGMRVRLAFAVAAHLEPEILVIDEVLAVGDVEFQRKCLGKMQAVGREGRTILFVSHNMSAVSSLCTRAIYLDTGMVQYDGAVKMALAQYLTPAAGSRAGYADVRDVAHRAGPREFSRLLSIETLGAERGRQGTFVMGDMMRVTIAFELQRSVDALEVGFTIRTPGGATLQTFLGHWENLPTSFGRGTHRVECAVPSIGVFPGSYVICPWVKRHSEGVDDQIVNAISFSVVGSNIGGATEDLERYPAAGVFQRATWSTQPAPVESMDTAVPVTLS